MNETPRALDLGSGPCPAAGYVGVDLLSQDSPRVVFADLWSGEPWPFEDGSIHALRASHVIEHIPHERVKTGRRIAFTREIRRPGKTPIVEQGSIEESQDAFFWFFDEAYRVAAPGCRFELAWPHPWHDHADQDPTHCRRVPSPVLFYLSTEGRRSLRVQHYPVTCDWQVESVTEVGTDASLKFYASDLMRARHHLQSFHEIQAVLFKKG